MYCRSCSFDLSGCEAPECPECGRAFEEHDPDSYLDQPRSELPTFVWVVIHLSLFIVLILFLAVFAYGLAAV